jgi:hypothetical protein
MHCTKHTQIGQLGLQFEWAHVSALATGQWFASGCHFIPATSCVTTSNDRLTHPSAMMNYADGQRT